MFRLFQNVVENIVGHPSIRKRAALMAGAVVAQTTISQYISAWNMALKAQKQISRCPLSTQRNETKRKLILGTY